jgi:hypothetical protein
MFKPNTERKNERRFEVVSQRLGEQFLKNFKLPSRSRRIETNFGLKGEKKA